MKELSEIILCLCDAKAVCGREYAAFDHLQSNFGGLFDECRMTPVGSFVGIIRAKHDNARTVLIDAPLDEPGFTVTKICGGGFLKVCANGQIDTRTLSASDVTVLGRRTAINGVFTSTPPHLQAPGDSDKPLTIDGFYIDTGLSYEECRARISVGDVAILSSECTMLLNGNMTGRALSNKACMAAAIKAVQELGKERDVNIICRFTAGTEVGSKDAKTSLCDDIDYAIIIDRANAYTVGSPERSKGISLGGGAVISYTAASSVRFTKYAASVAKQQGIRHQLTADGNGTASDITSVAVATHGAHTCLIELPVKNRRTQSEIVNISDAEAIKEICSALICRLEDDENV